MIIWTALNEEESNTKGTNNHGGLDSPLAVYWKIYGGWKALATSKYFISSIILTAIISAFASKETLQPSNIFSYIIVVSPSILAFTLAGLAVFLGVGGDSFRKAIKGTLPEEGGVPSPFIHIITTFTHFSIVQFISLFNAIAGIFTPIQCTLYGVFSLWLFIYSLLLILASILVIYELAIWYDEIPEERPDDKKGQYQ